MWGLEHCVRHTTAALYSSLPLIYIPSYLKNIRCNGTFESCPIEVCYRHNNGCQMSRFCTCIEYIFGLTPFGSQPVTFHSQTQGISRANALLRLKYNSPFIEKIMPLWYNAVLRSWQTAGEGLRQPDAARLLCSQCCSCCWTQSTGLHFNSNASVVPSVPSTLPAHFLLFPARGDTRISLSWTPVERHERLEIILKVSCSCRLWFLLKALLAELASF